MRILRGALALLGVWCLPVVAASTPVLQRANTAPVFRYQVVTSYPHDRAAFTQGLVYLDGFLYEGTGLKGQSTIRKIKLETGEILQQRRIDDQYFGEGIAVWQNTLIQLTWQSEIGFVYDLATFEPSRRFTYKGEGWGLTHDGTWLIMSDGTPALRFFDPATLEETGRVTVRDGKLPVDDLNELEFVKGEILANVWNTTRIARISPKSGQVTAWIDFSSLLSARDAAGAEVMNGIAYDATRDRLFVTGKLWPRLFEVRIVEK
jgi:glutaminyl-peptide cyclotransferase